MRCRGNAREHRADDSVAALGLDRVYGLADAVVSKPAHPAVLAAMLARAIESRGAT